jgi:23S rRNA maturation-related 3'-5' exoribonuclease YhaM
MNNVIDNTKKEFLRYIDQYGPDFYNLISHVTEMEKWGKFMCENYPDADKEIIMLSVWLHDIGHYPIPTDIDHAVRSEERAKEFLTEIKYQEDKMTRVLHCVRSHRCKDVLPNTLEAKIIAFIDSASHITDGIYYKIEKDYKLGITPTRALDKMERDIRDLDAFPEIKEKIIGLYEAWKKLIIEYDKIDFLK